MMAGELRWLRAMKTNYIAIVWHPSQVMLRKIQALLLSLALKGLRLHPTPLCTHVGICLCV